MGQSTDQLLTSRNSRRFANPRFAAVRNQMAAGISAPLSKAAGVFDIAEPGFVAEDIDYDPHRRRFVVTSIQKQKLLPVAVCRRQRCRFGFRGLSRSLANAGGEDRFRRRLVWVTEVALNGFASHAPRQTGEGPLFSVMTSIAADYWNASRVRQTVRLATFVLSRQWRSAGLRRDKVVGFIGCTAQTRNWNASTMVVLSRPRRQPFILTASTFLFPDYLPGHWHPGSNHQTGALACD